MMALLSQSRLVAAERAGAARIVAHTAGMERADGFIPFYWDAAKGRVLLLLTLFDQDILYYVSAASGAGSVEMPLDRGILAGSVIHFQRSGPKVLVIEQNLKFRANGGSGLRASNVRESFASSVLTSLPVEAEEGGKVLVDATALFMRDAADVSGDLARLDQGRFRFDAERSGFYPERMKAFADNTEIETVATFAVEGAGPVVRNIVPDTRFMTMRIHHSFLRAPVGYRPRVGDPRIGVNTVKFQDYAKPVDEVLETEWVTRWRLEKQDPTAAISEPKKPIVFYLDPAIPEPIRSAMREGALWWNVAFEAAGFRNAVQVKDPAPDMDPMDIRYAWILWIDRDERGFSSGGTFLDPRTGEILGAKTRMDSHRIRTIANYWEAYTPDRDGSGEGMPAGQREMVLRRQALLTAHELGHVMGFGHNFASSLNERASVMEYPTPRVRVVNGKLDLSEAFQPAVGAYDIFMTRYAYTELDSSLERKALEAILADLRAQNVLFVPGTDPRWTWYDDRATPAEYLRETLTARRTILGQYGSGILGAGEPVGELRNIRMWMVYLHHRWAIESGLRYVGGMFHNIVVKGETLPPTQIVPAATQREVLKLLMEAIEPRELYLPESLLAQLTPDPGTNREDMAGDYAFDQLRAARILSALVLEPLLEPERAARLVAFSDRDPQMPTLPEIVGTVMTHTWNASRDAEPRWRSLRRVTQRVTMDSMMVLGASPGTSPEVRSYVLDQLTLLGKDLDKRRDSDPMTQAHYRQAARDIARYLENPTANAPKSVSAPWGERPRSRFPLPPGPPL
jgi:hypothetical protein